MNKAPPADLADRYLIQKKTIQQIADESGCHYNTAAKWIKQAGIVVPPRRERIRPLSEKFTRHCTPGPVDTCWLWRGACDRRGYGHMNVDGATVAAHRVSYELHVGLIPDGLWVLHRCDNPPCCNPSHLFVGSCQDNHDDMRSKGRQVEPPRMPGSSNPSVVLLPEQVAEIRRRLETGGRGINERLAMEFRVSRQLISAIKHGKVWRFDGPERAV